MDQLRMIVRGLERQLDNIHRELDYRAVVIERDRADLDGVRSRLGKAETVILHILGRLRTLEAGSTTFKTIEVLTPFLMIGLAIVYRVPLDQVIAALGAIK